MPSDLYWIDAPDGLELAIMARPRAGDWLEDEIAHWRQSGVGIVVSLLERSERDELGLTDEAGLCATNGIDYLSFPISDRGVPDDVAAVRRFASDLLKRNKAIAIHCRAGIGRSSLIAAVLLILRGTPPDAALRAIERARGTSIPDTEEQRDWVVRFGD